MTLDLAAARAEALFTSTLPTGVVDPGQVTAAIQTSVRAHGGVRGCAAAMAWEWGDHPDSCCTRMRWAVAVAGSLNARQAVRS